MAEKRGDIQGLRAWAVLAVLLFHFFPNYFPFGYLGVDMFFVMSGYLISTVLQGKPRNIYSVGDFFLKRVKRIFPLALLIALCNLFIISLHRSANLVRFGSRSALHAISFTTNFNVRDDGEDYFNALEKANDYFTHYWSLSVEIQFYFMAPFLLHLFMSAPTSQRNDVLYLTAISASSLLFSLSMPPEKAFSSVLCRLWQFFAGSIAFHLRQYFVENGYQQELNLHAFDIDQRLFDRSDEKHKALNNNAFFSAKIIYAIPITMLSLALVFFMLGEQTSSLRILVTSVAAYCMFHKLDWSLLCHRFIQLLGNASYALYLLHWPVICILKDLGLDQPINLAVTMVLCVAVSLAIHLTFEKWYLSLTTFSTSILVGVFYLSCLAIMHRNSMTSAVDLQLAKHLLNWTPTSEFNFTKLEIMRMNEILDDQLAESLTVPDCMFEKEKRNNLLKFCDFPRGFGKRSFLIIGNSYALSPGKLVVEHFKQHYNKISLRAASHCEPLINTKHKLCKNLDQSHRQFMDDVKREQPDILFIVSRYEEPGLPITGNVTSDPLYLYMLDKLAEYAGIVKEKIFILNSIPLMDSLLEIERRTQGCNYTNEEIMKEVIISDDEPMRRRNIQLAKQCSKCIFFDIKKPMLNKNGEFMAFDEKSKLHYFDSTIHYTSIGLQVVNPVFVYFSMEFNRLLDAVYPQNLI